MLIFQSIRYNLQFSLIQNRLSVIALQILDSGLNQENTVKNSLPYCWTLCSRVKGVALIFRSGCCSVISSASEAGRWVGGWKDG